MAGVEVMLRTFPFNGLSLARVEQELQYPEGHEPGMMDFTRVRERVICHGEKYACFTPRPYIAMNAPANFCRREIFHGTLASNVS
jgi:hypothetical protein